MKFKKLRSIILFAVLILSTIVAQAQIPAATATLDRTSLLIGDQATLTLSVNNISKQHTIKWAALPDSLRGWEIVDTGMIDTIIANGTKTLQQKLTITSFDSGVYNIPAFEFYYSQNNDSLKALPTNPIPLIVKTIDVDTSKPFKDIKDIAEVEQPGFMTKVVNYIKDHKVQTIWYVLGALVVLGLILFFILRKKKSSDNRVKETPFQRSIRLLQELEAQHLYEAGQIKEHYSALSDIVRTYLDDQFGMNAMEQTTDELLATVKKKSDMRKIRPELKRLLQTADLAKFAKANPLPQEHQACFDAAFTILNRTKPTETTTTNDQ